MRTRIANALEAAADRIRPRDIGPFAAVSRQVSRNVRAGVRDWKRYQKTLPKSERNKEFTFNEFDDLDGFA